MFSLTGKHIAVTGAGSGIGKSSAELLAKQGAFIYVMDVDIKAATETADRISSAEGQATAILLDVSQELAVKTAFEQITQLDGLFNCAGISHIGTIETTSPVDFNRLFQVNVAGSFFCMQMAIHLMKQHGGSIINMASIAASMGIPDRFAYSMTKSAVVGMTLSVARDYVGHNIRCNSISPGRVHTPFVDNFLTKNYPGKEQEMFEKLAQTQPIGRMANPDEIGALVVYLMSNEASFITGVDYAIDGGFLNLKM
jgi:2-keto-3-deoxy-L-fuconate dehydrogenase